MNLEYYYWYFPKAIPKNVCDDILKQADFDKNRETFGIIGGLTKDNRNLSKEPLTDKEMKDLKDKRDSNVIWMDYRWIYKELHPYIHTANKNAGWNFEWDFSEHCQFTKYKKGQYYGWHCDSWDKPYDKPDDLNSHKKIRKLSVTISLNDPTEYVGGNLEFDFRNQVDWERNKKKAIKSCEEIRPRGSIIVFPSFCWHRVAPVTSGTRYSLVIWNLGRPFK